MVRQGRLDQPKPRHPGVSAGAARLRLCDLVLGALHYVTDSWHHQGHILRYDDGPVPGIEHPHSNHGSPDLAYVVSDPLIQYSLQRIM